MRTLAVLMVATLLLVATEARACSCAEMSLEEEVRASSAIFTGKVVKLEVLDVTEGISTVSVSVDVEKRFIGTVPDRIIFQTSNGCCYCAPWFDIAKKYIFFAHRSGGELAISGCSRTKDLALAKEELEFFVRAEAPATD